MKTFRPTMRQSIGIVISLFWAIASSARAEQSSVSNVDINDLRLFSRIDPDSLASFSCEKSDYQNMTVCSIEKKTGSGKREIYARSTLTFGQDLGELFYIFSLQKNVVV